ncbi:MAG: two-component system, OmpR family, response regulator, partial [Actinomycetota bacterium]|nr:two-component system, OmpR family, response regulator [Actinomycetota bacterium]
MRIPRLLVVADGDGELPLPIDCLEDWVTSGAPEWEVDARRHALVLRSGQHAVRPLLDEDGLLHHRDAWVSLSPVEQALAGVLLDRFGAVVTREMLADRAWPAG